MRKMPDFPRNLEGVQEFCTFRLSGMSCNLPDELFNLHLGMSGDSSSDTRRRLPRRPYFRRELVADFDSESVPELSDFYWVTFQNISDTGAAFLSSRKPETDKLVIVLGGGPSVVARVVWTRCRSESPETIYEVGCEFERRLIL